MTYERAQEIKKTFKDTQSYRLTAHLCKFDEYKAPEIVREAWDFEAPAEVTDQEIIASYKQCRSMKDTAAILSIDVRRIAAVLDAHGVKRIRRPKKG